MKTKWLHVKAGKKAFQKLQENGLQRDDISIIAGAAGGPKWLILYELDKYLIDEYLPGHSQDLHFVGASIGAWRSMCYVHSDPRAAIDRLFQAYAYQTYEGVPTPADVSQRCKEIIEAALGTDGPEAIFNPKDRHLHVVTSRAHFNTRTGSSRALEWKFGRAVVSNLLSRKRLRKHFTRVIFSNSSTSLLDPDMLPEEIVPFNAENLLPGLMASGSIPTIMNPVVIDEEEYWDGGITDYHLNLNYKLDDKIVLYPHFLNRIIPGWLDKHNPFRKSNPDYDQHTVLLYPSDEFLERLPNQKVPDRTDFERYYQNDPGRFKAWQEAADLGKDLVEDFVKLLEPKVLRENLREL